MTIDEYKSKYGDEFREEAAKPWFAALVQTLKDSHPVRGLNTYSDGDKLTGSAMLLGKIGGYEECLSNIDIISQVPEPSEEEQESKYAESEIP